MLRATGKAVTRVLGWTEPRPYDAGEINGTKFAAGVSFRVCVAVDDHGFQVFKVKDAEAQDISKVLATMTPGATVEIEFQDPSGTSPFGVLRALKLAQPAAAAAGR